MLIWQLAREVWWYESPFPISAIGYALEPFYLRAYRQTPAFTFSKSTANDLRALGFEGELVIVPVGIHRVALTHLPKDREPTFIYVGRLAPSKRVHQVVQALALFRKSSGLGKLALVGDGPRRYVIGLVRLARRLGIEDSVEFCGWLKGSAKYQRMASAHALLLASAREGWGLVVTECNANGTPAVVYDVPGLRDSVRHLETGLVVCPTPECLAEGMIQLIRDPDLYRRLRKTALVWSQSFTYEAGLDVVNEKLGEIAQMSNRRVTG